MTDPDAALSRPLAWTWGTLLLAGTALGAVTYLERSPAPERHVAGTEAWWPHLGIAVAAAAWTALGVLRRRSGRCLQPPLLGLPFTRAFALRIRATVRPRHALRLAGAALPLLLLAYFPVRFGQQIIGGLDPNFTANAWGGPGYWGAMACHYLDGLLIAAVAVALLRLVLAPASVSAEPSSPARRRDPRR